MGKKRRQEIEDLVDERTLYSSFVQAANSMSQLYSQAVQQQRKSSAAASRQTLERMLAFILREHDSSDMVPKAALLQFLQQEYENLEGSEHQPHQFPVQFLPTPHGAHTPSTTTMDEHAFPETASKPPTSRGLPTVSGQALLSPSAKRGNSGSTPTSMSAMDTADPHAVDSHMTAGPLQPLNLLPHPDNKFFMHGGPGFGAC